MLIKVYHRHETKDPELYDSAIIKIVDSIFIDNKYLFVSNLSHFIIENCNEITHIYNMIL